MKRFRLARLLVAAVRRYARCWGLFGVKRFVYDSSAGRLDRPAPG